MIYFTADLHFGDEKIIFLAQRPFRDVKTMNEQLIENYNSFITDNDTVYFLGDVASKITFEETWEIMSRLKGHKILIKGNHDYSYNYNEQNEVKKIFEEICEYIVVDYNGIVFVMMHYPLLSWFNSRKGSVMLHGHIHAKRSYNVKNQIIGLRRFDVGIDANNYFPVSINQIKDWLMYMPEKTEFHLAEYYLDAMTLAE